MCTGLRVSQRSSDVAVDVSDRNIMLVNIRSFQSSSVVYVTNRNDFETREESTERERERERDICIERERERRKCGERAIYIYRERKR